jgi:hypothetical protein
MIHTRQTIVSPFYFKIIYMKILFEMLFKTFPPSPDVIYFFVVHLTSCHSSRIYFSDGLTGFPSTKHSSQSHFQQFLMPLSISKFLLESLSTTLEGWLPVTSRLKTCDFRLRLKSVLLTDIFRFRLQDTYIYHS